MTVEEAIKKLNQEYNKASQNPNINDAVAYALYKTWRMADAQKRKSKQRRVIK